MLGDPGDSQSGSQKSITMSYVGSKRNSRSPGKRNRHLKSKRNGAESRMELNVGSRNDVGLDGIKFTFYNKNFRQYWPNLKPKATPRWPRRFQNGNGS
jgi:hypothetical protein